ncbi:hypothetical protein D2E25_0264 [Bifidobacterium goeldii]|uniref:Uncharacterized protein n=1 Tax=Bifidobacterium goeldii TaxID=2306975 RepID=A0A430FMI3_9BIFI|nr:hypothetical protein D2E25_0264 [Bifidobacterium goeldii]
MSDLWLAIGMFVWLVLNISLIITGLRLLMHVLSESDCDEWSPLAGLLITILTSGSWAAWIITCLRLGGVQ